MRSEIRQLPIEMALRAVRGPKNLPGICYVGWPTMMGRSGSHRTMGDLGVRHWPDSSGGNRTYGNHEARTGRGTDSVAWPTQFLSSWSFVIGRRTTEVGGMKKAKTFPCLLTRLNRFARELNAAISYVRWLTL